MTTNKPGEFRKLKLTQENLGHLIQAMDQMEGMPTLLADKAVRSTADAYAPLQDAKKVELPQKVKASGRALRDAAQAFADTPNHDTLSDWRVAARALYNALSDTALRKRFRAADSTPKEPRKINPEHIMPGMREQEAYGVPSADINWKPGIPGGW